MFDNLQDFLKHLEKNGELQRITVEVEPELEIKEIEKYISLLFIKVINVDPNKKPEDGMTRTEIESPEAI